MASETRFRTQVREGHKGAAVEVPFDPGAAWAVPIRSLRAGRRGFRAVASLNGIAFRSAIVPRSRRFWLLVEAQVLDTAGVAVGDLVDVAVAPATDADD